MGSGPEGTAPDVSPSQIAPPFSANWQRLGSATAAFTIANFGTKALSFLVLIPIYTRFLSPGEFGIVSLSETMAVVVATIYASTFEISIQRFYHRYRDPKRARACISTLIQIGSVFIAGICFLTFIFGPVLIRHLFPHFTFPFYPYIGLAIGTFALNQIISYRLVLYQAEQQAIGYVALSLVLFVAIAIGSFTFIVFLHAGALGMLIGKFIPTAIVAMGAVFLLRGWMVWGWDRETVSEFTKFAVPISAYPFILLGLNIGDRLILQMYRSTSEVGVYSLAYGIGMAMSLLGISLYQSWTPVFYRTAAQGEAYKPQNARLVTGALLVKLFFAIVGVSLSPLFVSRLMDPRYREGAILVPYIICGYLLRGFTFSFHVPLLAAGKTLATSISGTVALVVNLAINFAFIPRHGIYAAAYATVIAYGVELAIVYVFAQRIYPLPYARRKLAVGMLLLALTFLISQSPLRDNTFAVVIAMIGALACTLNMIRTVAQRNKIDTHGRDSASCR